MLISSKKKFIFIHNPKVAGSSIRTSLNTYSNKKLMRIYQTLSRMKYDTYFGHLSASQVQSISLPWIFKNYFKFGFVRNPWEREVSAFNFTKGLKEHPEIDLEYVQKLNFNEYLEWKFVNRLSRQKPYFYDEHGKQLVDFVGRFEDLKTGYDYINNKLGIDSQLVFVNKSIKNKSYQKFYNVRTAEMVYEAYKEDCDFFGYQITDVLV